MTVVQKDLILKSTIQRGAVQSGQFRLPINFNWFLDRYKIFKMNKCNSLRLFRNINSDSVPGTNMTLLLMMMEVTAVMFNNSFFALQCNWHRIVIVRNVCILMSDAITNFDDISLGDGERRNENSVMQMMMSDPGAIALTQILFRE